MIRLAVWAVCDSREGELPCLEGPSISLSVLYKES